ncbi:PREDICTED: neutral alpha-glucosidase C-like [Erythranthe guttata]|uniref:neutral alpha-glucosidase C-like n=1 Tax=Erythranthe guttata TaxID=4155 RepID=UPI00064DE5B9|nr:PREDICTED: neutral alpha-glucosidase C-like [Erythranthe guttata]|eukprot:XP_012847183.1 PREDICTED: neutral alpha-glucosidase C-like [Erythranthe guttata]
MQQSVGFTASSCSCVSTTSNWSLRKLTSLRHFNSTAFLLHTIRKSKAKKWLINKKSVVVSKMAGYEEGKSSDSEGRIGKMIFESILEEGVFRFDCSADDRNAAFPSISFQNPKVRDTPLANVDEVPTYIPTFECSLGQQIVNIEFPPNTSFYGTGEVSGQLERTGKRIFTWNTDAWGYGSGTTSLYQSHPWVLAILPNGEAFGVLADTTRRCEIDLRKESKIKFVSSSAYPVITFGPFASPTDVLVSFSRAVGTVFMPPMWSLGYHQCRWSYDSDARVREIARTFREKGIPCDVIWMDIDYMDGFRCFTFDQERFPDPKSLVDDLHKNGFKAIWMLDPGIKHEEGYFVYDSGSEKDIWVQNADGKPFVGDVWPGPCVFPDFTQSSARSWWSNLVKDFISNGVDGIWNDMNEPAVFQTLTKTMPESNIHRGDSEIGGIQNHSHYHNVYGMLMARSTYEGMKLANGQKRPFVLTRAGFVGSQRYAATWTGDNLSTWEHLHMSISMVVQLGLSGQPLCGPDIGGFAGNATPKLFGRWMGVGSLFPFCRGHSETNTIDHEPWSFGEECEEVCRLALRRRYRLLHHIYTLFYMAHTRGIPVATPTFFADPKDMELRTHENSFLLGPVLVYASTGRNHELYKVQHKLPKGIWLGFDFEDTHPDLPALYLQGGSIIPVSPLYQSVDEIKHTDDLSLLVALNELGKAEGVLFEDDGDGYEYTRGGYLLTTYIAERESSMVTVKVLRTEGSKKRPNRKLNVQILIGKCAMIDAWGVDGEILQIAMPSDSEVSDLVTAAEKQLRIRIESAKIIPDTENISGHKGTELSRTPVELKSGEWVLKIVPWIGGRIISMQHIPSVTQWLHSRVDVDGYEEYSGMEHRSAGCSEEYSVVERDLQQAGETESVQLECDIGGGLVLERQLYISKNETKVFRIDSGIVAREVGAGSGGFSRLVCLRVNPKFNLMHPTQSYISFTAIDGSKHEIWPESSEHVFEGDLRPHGEWMLIDKSLGLALVNRFSITQVQKCVIGWGTGSVNMELRSENRPVSTESPLKISHMYEVIGIK